MTLLDDRPPVLDPHLALSPSSEHSELPPRLQRVPASPSTDGGLIRWTFTAAVAITTVIAGASFVLSFATLWDLATMAGLPRNLSWLWPVIVDGTILQATISVIALASSDAYRSGRRFFWSVLAVSALVSISSNALHAFISGSGSLHPALAAAIATVAPISLLASTHGIAVLARINSSPRTQLDEAANTQRGIADYDARTMSDLEAGGPWPDWEGIAHTMRRRGISGRPPEEIAQMLRHKFVDKWSNRRIAEHVDLHHSTVGSVVNAAKAVEPGLAHASV